MSARPEHTTGAADVTVITVTYNSSHQLAGFIDSINKHLPEATIVIVDNASRDGVASHASLAHPRVRLIQNSANVGFGRACNLGAREADTGWLLFANPDVRLRTAEIPDPTPCFGIGAAWLTDKVGRVVPGTQAEPRAREDWSHIVYGTFLPPPVARRVTFHRNQPAEWATGALFLVRQDEFFSIGGFDERYFLYMEDRDLGRRYRNNGLPIRALPGLVGEHSWTTSSRDVTDAFRDALGFASWLEYVGIWSGQSAADRTARHAHRVYRVGHRLGALPGTPPRVRRKGAKLAAMLAHLSCLESILPDDKFLPHARAALQAVRPS